MSYNDLFSFYRSSEWQSLRTRVCLERTNENGDLICEHCGKPILRPYDAICHHKQELTEETVQDASIALNPDNIAVIHFKCHNAVHERYSSYAKHVYIVWGSPCAGKREFVKQNAGPHDLIIDIDSIYEAVNLTRSGRVYSNVMQIYNTLIDMVKTRNGKWINAWIIRTLPLAIDREMIVKQCNGGELIHIDTPKEICLGVAKTRGREWEKFVNDWWARYIPPAF